MLVGILNFETIRLLISNPLQSKFTTVKEQISQPKSIINHDDGMEAIMDKFDVSGAICLPVLINGKFYGTVSKTDLLQAYREKLKDMVIE